MAIALLGQRAQTLPIEHPGRYSSPDWVSYASRRKELRVEMRPLSVDWELPRRSLPVDKETVPKTPLPNIKDIGHNLDDPIELTDGEEGNNDDGASITATMDSETGFARPGATEAQAQSALGKDRSTMQHISQGSERHQDQLDSSFLHDRVEDLSKADDLVLHEMLMRAPVDDDNLNGYDEAKTGPASNLQAGMKEENTLKDMYSQKKSPASTGSEISQLMGDLLQEDVAAVVGASQVPYDGPGNEAGRAPRADMAMESDSLTSRDGNGVIASSAMTMVGRSENHHSSWKTNDAGIDLSKPEEHPHNDSVQASGEAKEEAADVIRNTAGRDEPLEKMTIAGLQAPKWKDDELRLLHLDETKQLESAEADRALKLRKDLKKARKSIAAQVLRAQMERERTAERLKRESTKQVSPETVGNGEKNHTLCRKAQTDLATQAAAKSALALAYISTWASPAAATATPSAEPVFNKHPTAMVGKCAADALQEENQRGSTIPLRDAEDTLRSALDRCQKQKPQTAMLSSEKHPEGRVPKKARSNEPDSQHTNDIVPTARPNIGYTGTMRSPGSTQSSAASPKSRRTKMTTPEREESRRLSALKYRRKKAQERALGQSAVSLGRTGSQGHSSNHSSPGFSSSRDGEREAALNPTRMGFAALSRWSPSPSHCNLILPQPVSKRGHPKSNQKSPKSEGKRDRRQEYQRLNERRRLEKEDKEFQDAIGSATTSFATTAGAVGEFYFESMDPMEVDSEPEEDLSRPATGGKTITKEMIDILQHKPESLTSYVSKGPQQAEDGDGTYYEFLVKRLSWTADNVEEPEDIEPLLCGSGYISVEAANKAAGDEIQLERGDIRVYPLDEFHWKRDRETGMAICDASSERGNVRVFVDRVLRPRDQGIKPSKRALKAARKINPTVYVIIVKNTMVNAADSEALDELFEEQSPERTSVHVEIDVVGVCRTRDLANKMASKYVLNRLKEYQDAGKLEEIKRAEDEAEQRKYLGDLEEEEGFYCIETELPGGSGLLEVWVKAQFLKGPCN
ncbi:hypothetical protein MMC08_000172 [Hypocenomyce scalaris]|nr:hypothetical protein [Hypocenomyce scalaris]